MISDLQANFISLRFPEMDFLINSDEVDANLFLENVRDLSVKCNYFCGAVRYKIHNVLLVDFDEFLKKNFNVSNYDNNPIAILCSIRDSRLYYSHLREYLNKEEADSLSHSYIALLVKNEFELEKISIGEIKLIPEPIRKEKMRNGVLGIRFIGQKGQYLLDIEKIISSGILQEGKRNESPDC